MLSYFKILECRGFMNLRLKFCMYFTSTPQIWTFQSLWLWIWVFQVLLILFILAIKRKGFESVVVNWMNLEPLTQSEVCQKEKSEYPILRHIHMESRKMALMNLVENRLVDTASEGEGGMNWESSADKCTLSRVK